MNGTIMKGIVASLAGMLVMACSGCGGGGGGGGGSDSAPAGIQSAQKPVIVWAEGDSTMYGLSKDQNGSPFQSSSAPPVILQQALRQTLGSDAVIVINNGVPSASAQDSLSGTPPYYSQPFDIRLAHSDAQLRVVIENYAINDMQKRTPSQFYDDLSLWIQRVRAAGKTPVLEEPNPITRPGLPDPAPYAAVVRKIGSDTGVPVVEQYDYILSLPNWQSMLVDGVHPTDELYKIKAQREADVLVHVMQPMVVTP